MSRLIRRSAKPMQRPNALRALKRIAAELEVIIKAAPRQRYSGRREFAHASTRYVVADIAALFPKRKH